MKKPVLFKIVLGASLLFAGTPAWCDTQSEIDQLKQIIQEQRAINEKQQEVISEQQEESARQQELILQLQRRMTDLESGADSGTSPAGRASSPGRVDLEAVEIDEIRPTDTQTNVLERPWYKNIRIDGFGGAGFVGTGGEAVKQHGSFVLHEATINVEADVWDDISYFHEIQTVRMGDENTKFLRTGEVYGHFKDFFHTFFDKEGADVGVKVGRMDIPFGEDYLTQDVHENPLITFSAAYPYGWDEGVVVYGKYSGLGWIAALMDGHDDRAFEDNKDKSISLKLYGNPLEDLYLSGSFLRNGKSSESAFEFGGSHLIPVGSSGYTSTLGSSADSQAESYVYEFDAKYTLGYDRYLKAQFGYASLDDDDSAFDRDIYYFQVEPKWNLGPRFNNKWYLVSRFSAIGTFEDDEGYTFDGKPYKTGKATFGFDTKALYRYAVGLGFYPNPRTLIKLEYSIDDFSLIDASTQEGGTDGHELFGLMMAVKF